MIETFLTPAQAARLLGITAERVRQLAEKGRLPVVMTPLGRLFDPAEVEAFRLKRLADPRNNVRGG